MSIIELLNGVLSGSSEFYYGLDVLSNARGFVWSFLFMNILWFIGWSYRAEHNTFVKALWIVQVSIMSYDGIFVLSKLYGYYFVC